MTAAAPPGAHALLMDSVYRWQRHIYDLTRKYYLFGRDRLLRDLALAGRGQGQAVLEIGCGTGRNLAQVRRRWPDAVLFGIDISAEMLKSARKALGDQAVLAVGDATCFDSAAMLGCTRFDRIIMPYCLSMIPGWDLAMSHACGLLARGGSLAIVDFGDMAGLPGILRHGLRAWLAQFHVTPRDDLAGRALALASARGLGFRAVRGPAGYYQMIILTRPR